VVFFEKNRIRCTSLRMYSVSNKKNKALLYIAYHYPPIIGSSGVHRSLAFTRHLSKSGWQVNVLTTSLKAYVKWDKSLLSLIPHNVTVIRAFALDVARHLSFRGKYFDWMTYPDRWQCWIPFAIISGWLAIRKNHCRVIVSTYPIASAHVIAYVLHRITGVPWVADLRDPMAQVDYPLDIRLKKVFMWIERKMVIHCKKILITAPSAKALYTNRFPESPPELWEILPNGYDGELIDQYIVEKSIVSNRTPLRLLHSGTLYAIERDPNCFFQALSELKAEEPDLKSKLEVWLRATGFDEYHANLLNRYGITDIVTIKPSLAYKDAIRDIQLADALLLMQSDGCNYQIPAKAYEYIRVKNPILALTDPDGDSAELMNKSNVAIIAPLDDVKKIKCAIIELMERCRGNEFVFLADDDIERFSRKYQAIRLDHILSEID
jgi:hypothetical protein